MAGAVVALVIFPETKNLQLEEVAAIFGDADEVAVYAKDIHITDAHEVVVIAN